jgi:cytochrome c-type biogenesis protein CcmE
MTRKNQRLWFLGCLLTFATGLVVFLLTTINDHLLFFVTPSELKPGIPVRLGGLVVQGSIQRTESVTEFVVSDGESQVRVRHEGIVPDLFREGQGVIAEGQLTDGLFQSTTLLAKHDENYMPREVADALKEKGVWKP